MREYYSSYFACRAEPCAEQSRGIDSACPSFILQIEYTVKATQMQQHVMDYRVHSK